ncbi:MAG: pilus assembly protein [Bacillota bacterium]|nr:pilus assembly protein [Bacillota bacterium]
MIKNIFIKIKDEEDGAVIVIVAILMVVFLSLLAITLDVGSAYLETGDLQKAADAAVYSAGRLLPVQQTDTAAINGIKDSAINYAELNGYSGLTYDKIVLGNIVNGNYTAIKVTADKSVNMTFARIFGVNTINITRSAKAMLSPKNKMTGLTPIGMLKSDFDAMIQSGNTKHVVLKYGKGGGVNGFFGALDLDGSKGGGASNYSLWIAHGYPGEVTLGDVLLYENGNMVGPTFEGFSERYNSCTHYGATTGGDGCTAEHFDPDCPRVAKVAVYYINSSYTAIVCGFASFVLESQTSDGYITGSFVKTLTYGGSSTGGSAGSSGDFGTYSLMLSE